MAEFCNFDFFSVFSRDNFKVFVAPQKLDQCSEYRRWESTYGIKQKYFLQVLVRLCGARDEAPEWSNIFYTFASVGQLWSGGVARKL